MRIRCDFAFVETVPQIPNFTGGVDVLTLKMGEQSIVNVGYGNRNRHLDDFQMNINVAA